MTKATLKLFKTIPIKTKRKAKLTKELLRKTLLKGYIFSPEVVANYSNEELDSFINIIDNELGLSPEQMNSSFHKSWHKVKTASIEQLVLEQMLHYITTYGFESLGVYDENSVYIPNEKLDIPELKENLNFILIKGLTKDEIKEKTLSLINSGIALKEETMNDIMEVITFVGISQNEIEEVKNKEIKIQLYDKYNLVPKNPVEFLRYLLYKTTEKTLLIKNKETIKLIKTGNLQVATNLFYSYKQSHGLEKLSTIFYRFKPIFLAFKTNKFPALKSTINKIRKLAVIHHKPMSEDLLNNVTSKLKNHIKINVDDLIEALENANVFRKIRLLYALKFRQKGSDVIMYRVRNGKSYVEDFKFDNVSGAKVTYDMVFNTLALDIEKNVKGKTVYIPDYIKYTLPSTEKQFTGYFPTGTCVTIDKNMIFGVHWENQGSHRIDLDLSLINVSGKIGWDASYRNDERSILFSGDVTDAPLPKGASELFYVRRQSKEAHLMSVNYYNYNENVSVPMKIMVGKESISNLRKNHMINPNNVLTVANSTIDKKQTIVGMIVTTTNECRFYFNGSTMGNKISSSVDEQTLKRLKYLLNYYDNTIYLNDLLIKAGATIVNEINDDVKVDIDLSPEKLEKDTILNLLI